MMIRKGYKYRLNTHPNQSHLLRFYAGACRFVWNKALAIQKERLLENKKVYKYEELADLLVQWKNSTETSFLKDVPSQALQQTLKQLDRALWDGLKKEKGMPVFKKKGRDNSFRYPQGFALDESRVFLPKVGWLSFRKSREISGTPKNVTVSEKCGKWFVSIQVEEEIGTPIHPSHTAVGIDRGVSIFAALSDGTKIEGQTRLCEWRESLQKSKESLLER